VAFVGGGGKTSLLLALGRELAAADKRVVGTTTTRMAAAEVKGAPAYGLLQDLAQLGERLDKTRFCLVVGGLGREKAQSVSPALPARLLSRDDVDVVLVEADGARQLPVKAPAAHEPVIPPETTLLVPVVGIDALSAPLQDVAHRPRLVAELTGCLPEETLSPQDVALLLTHPQGGLKSAPAAARIIPFINKVETEEQLAQAAQIARRVAAHPRITRVLIGAAKRDAPLRTVHEASQT
jgi:molybdenum cofactor cytidylyltransferase